MSDDYSDELTDAQLARLREVCTQDEREMGSVVYVHDMSYARPQLWAGHQRLAESLVAQMPERQKKQIARAVYADGRWWLNAPREDLVDLKRKQIAKVVPPQLTVLGEGVLALLRDRHQDCDD